ncbi:MAG: esterase/lipase family protein, partial [Caldilineaceae bacterium]
YTVADMPETTLGLFQVRHVPQAWTADVYPATFARPVAGGELRYTPALTARPGERVALLLHGFADDSAEEATWLLTHLRDAGVIYDRVLTFEYESLRTPVEENATRLAVALEQLGYGAQAESARGVTIDLFGHSMGALIGRWYVERLGGDAVVERSVFFGVPNEGTPLAAASLLAPWMLAAAINVARPALPSLVVAWALGTLALDVQGPADLRPGAVALTALARPPLPARTRYHLIAGDAALVPSATAEEEVTRARPARLLASLAGGAQAAASLFYGGAHDWAVSVQSALALRAGKAPGSTVMSFVAPTHHLGFFASPEVTRQVALWLVTPEDAVG